MVAFTGAGISVESGIPPFRGENGLWQRYDPQVLDLTYFHRHPAEAWRVIKEIFYDFFGQAQPNPAHQALAQLERAGRLAAVITQNIDHLHQEAGSQNVIEFHGTSRRLRCLGCQAVLPFAPALLETLPPACPRCGGLLKPDFIFFGEGIPASAYRRALAETRAADVWLLVGASGQVMPAAYLPLQARDNGATLIEINTEPSAYTQGHTDLFLCSPAGAVLPALAELVLSPQT